MIGQIQTFQVAEPGPTRGFRYTTEADQIKAIEQLIHAGYKIRDGKFVKDSRSL